MRLFFKTQICKRCQSAAVPGLVLASWLIVLAAAAGCVRRPPGHTPDGRVIVHYWEKWTGFEGEAMEAIVSDFNASQTNIYVEKLTVSEIASKLMLATAGGDPPDVAGLWSHSVNTYAEKGALVPLDRMLAAANITSNQYIPIMWTLCGHRGHQWALPTTPASIALHWNRKLFREAGLDPDRPPRSLAELDRMGERLTIVEVERNGQPVSVRFDELTPDERASKQFKVQQMGYSPNEPGWWNEMWGFWFGSRLWDGDRKITAMSPENLQAVRWFKSYADKYGLDNLDTFGSQFGNFASPQNAFLSGKVAMVLQGVWMYNFIDKYAPRLDWAAAPFPSHDPEQLPMVTIAECDVLVIPKGARHTKEAFEFMRYVNTQSAMEKLCLAQRKFSPLSTMSPGFVSHHPNPFIQVFIDLARSPNVRTVPRISVWNEYKEELRNAYDRAFHGIATPEDALAEAQRRVQWKYDRVLRRWDLIKDQRLKEWNSE